MINFTLTDLIFHLYPLKVPICCHNDNLQYHQCEQSCHHDNSPFSVSAMCSLGVRRVLGFLVGIIATMASGVNLTFAVFAPNLKEQFELPQTASMHNKQTRMGMPRRFFYWCSYMSSYPG